MGDLILDRGGKSQIATIVEPTTRYTLLVPLPTDRKAHTVRDAIASTIVELPEQLRRSLTRDQGKEMAASMFDPVNELAGRFSGIGARTIPTTIFRDPQGRVAARLLGLTDTREIVAFTLVDAVRGD